MAFLLESAIELCFMLSFLIGKRLLYSLLSFVHLAEVFVKNEILMIQSKYMLFIFYVSISCFVLAVPGWPLIGNLLQLREKKPFLTFVKWAQDYGPIYSIRCGASSMIALVTKFSSISMRKLSNALTTLTCNKALVAMSDYGEYHKTVKRYVLSGLLSKCSGFSIIFGSCELHLFIAIS
ncbi:hypothetical protein IEQ34_017466 [Dendrobium chrysotoxum]|uniref:Uncharacterized protein n=1 Tax=Dendrobium chrysotoxum TaxID=161865 RepID=A0AAV7GBH0_DENCH|nr:hypothetical protein IEQ34_017466 [Dendrobium chrysotoxum]